MDPSLGMGDLIADVPPRKKEGVPKHSLGILITRIGRCNVSLGYGVRVTAAKPTYPPVEITPQYMRYGIEYLDSMCDTCRQNIFGIGHFFVISHFMVITYNLTPSYRGPKTQQPSFLTNHKKRVTVRCVGSAYSSTKVCAQRGVHICSTLVKGRRDSSNVCETPLSSQLPH